MHTFSDLSKITFGRFQQLLALAGALGGDQRVAANDQPLTGVVLGGDLGEVLLVKERELQHAVADELLDLRRLERRDPPNAFGVLRVCMLALVTIPRSETTTTPR